MPDITWNIAWDETSERLYETGVDRGVCYPMDENGAYPEGSAWNGLTAVNESPSGAESNPLYADNIKYLDLRSAEEFGATIEAYTFPDAFAECDGYAEIVPGVKAGQQQRKKFGFSYRSLIGNDVKNNDYGYKLHLVYGCTAAPSEKSRSTVNDSPEAITFSWELSTVPVTVPNMKPTAHIELDSTKVSKAKMAAVEAVLYGTAATAGTNGAEGTAATTGRLPLPTELITIINSVTG